MSTNTCVDNGFFELILIENPLFLDSSRWSSTSVLTDGTIMRVWALTGIAVHSIHTGAVVLTWIGTAVICVYITVFPFVASSTNTCVVVNAINTVAIHTFVARAVIDVCVTDVTSESGSRAITRVGVDAVYTDTVYTRVNNAVVYVCRTVVVSITVSTFTGVGTYFCSFYARTTVLTGFDSRMAHVFNLTSGWCICVAGVADASPRQ